MTGRALAILALAARLAVADEVADARARFSRGAGLLREGKAAEALIEFRAVHEATQDPLLLVHVAAAQEGAGDGAGALATYRAYLAALPDAADRVEIEARAAALANTVAPAIAAEEAGGQEEEEEEGEEEAGDALVVVSERSESGPPSRLERSGWITLGGGAVLLSVAGVFGLMAEAHEDDLERQAAFRDNQGRPAPFEGAIARDWDRLHDEGGRYADWGRGFLLAGAVAVVAGVVMLVLD